MPGYATRIFGDGSVVILESDTTEIIYKGKPNLTVGEMLRISESPSRIREMSFFRKAVKNYERGL